MLHVPTTPPPLALGLAYAYRSSDRVRPTPMLSVPAAPSNQLVHQPTPSLSSSLAFPFPLGSRPRPLPFLLEAERVLVG